MPWNNGALPGVIQHRITAKATDTQRRRSKLQRAGRKDLLVRGFGFGGISTGSVRIQEHPPQERLLARINGVWTPVAFNHDGTPLGVLEIRNGRESSPGGKGCRIQTRYDLRSPSLPPLSIGANVRVQDPISKL